jgi:hypothetical protein
VKKQIEAANKKTWLNRWALEKTGKDIFKYMHTPNTKGSINILKKENKLPFSDCAVKTYNPITT